LTAKVLVFSCNWDGWSCIDAAASASLSYPASVSIVKLTCISSLNAGLLLKSFEHGADGLMILGCKNKQCKFGQYDESIDQELRKAEKLLRLVGIDRSRVELVTLDAFDGPGFAGNLNRFVSTLTALRQPALAQGVDQAC
jgi:coenzyme F420-reducing hydrogenase delta subunit